MFELKLVERSKRLAKFDGTKLCDMATVVGQVSHSSSFTEG
jgi:hypothetical protein